MLHRVYFLLLALVLLSGCTDGNERRLQLEELERQNRADSLMTNDSLALDLAQWFDRHGTPNEQLRAHYILGRTYADRGETPQALNAYNDAADRADTTAKDCDYRTLSRVHAQMAQLYYSQLLPDNMIRHNRLAMRYAEAANDTMGYIACYAMLAEGYEMKIMPDSALDILSEAYQLYKDADANELAAGLCCSMADLFRQKDNYIQSEKCIQEYERDSEFFNEYGNVESGKEMYYYSKGQLCLDSSDKDNAEYYFRKLLSVANNYDLEIAALDGLQRFYAKFFNRDSLIKYVHLRDSICNIAHNNIEMQKTLQVQAMYDYTRSELVAIQKEREAERFKTTMIIFSALSVILALSSAIVYICNQNPAQPVALFVADQLHKQYQNCRPSAIAVNRNGSYCPDERRRKLQLIVQQVLCKQRIDKQHNHKQIPAVGLANIRVDEHGQCESKQLQQQRKQNRQMML